MEQLIVQIKQADGKTEVRQLPIEDVGYVVLEHREITFTMSVVQRFHENNTAMIFCNDKHLPIALNMPLDGHQLQAQRFQLQINSSAALKKNLWKQVIQAKIRNQAGLLKILGKEDKPLRQMINKVQSGDSTNMEAQAARRYWQTLMEDVQEFTREREGMFPNPLFNYGYAILRAATARALSGSGLLPTFGIHHHNRYNAYALADDIMEPYRPFVDKLVYELLESEPLLDTLDRQAKMHLLKLMTLDVKFPEYLSPLMVALTYSSASLAKCFAGEKKHLQFPEIVQSFQIDDSLND